jgi:glycosyltransferase involved in cell wall biosynthesis
VDIDVVMPVRNGEQFIARALESLLLQTKKPSRVVVVNDGSTDQTLKVVESFAGRELNLEIVSTDPLGLSAARNRGIRKSKANFISLLDCDDFWEKDKLLNQSIFLEEHPEARIVFSQCAINDEVQNKTYSAVNNGSVQFSRENVLIQKYRVIGSASSATVHRCVFEEVGYFDENLQYGEDYDFWVRASHVFQFYGIPNRDVIITKRLGSMQKSRNPKQQLFKNSMMYLYVWSKEKSLTPELCTRLKELIWRDISTSFLKNPLNPFRFESQAREDYSALTGLLFPRKRSFAVYILTMSLKDLIGITSHIVQKYQR